MEAWEQEAIRRVLAGDREEYRVLMERHLPAVLRMTLRVTGNPQDAEEAAQDAFLVAYRKLSSFRKQASFGTWVYRIAITCALNQIKRRGRTPDWHADSLLWRVASCPAIHGYHSPLRRHQITPPVPDDTISPQLKTVISEPTLSLTYTFGKR